MTIPPLGKFLDVREQASPPFAEAVNIPLSELRTRLHELPPKSEIILIADCHEAKEAKRFLCAGGRLAEIVPAPTEGPGVFRLWRPNTFLELSLSLLPKGRALDLGCGSGRDSLLLAASGYSVTGIDHLPDAIQKARDLQKVYLPNANIDWQIADASSVSIEGFDLVWMGFFFDEAIVDRALESGAAVAIEMFTSEHRRRRGKPRNETFDLPVGEIFDDGHIQTRRAILRPPRRSHAASSLSSLP